MNSVSINGTNLSSHKLYLPAYEIPSPEPFIYLVQVEGHDGLVDMTDAFGRTYYKNRDWTLDFVCVDPTINWHTISSTINSLCHGKKFPFVFDNDPNFYWIGRITNRDFASSQGEGIYTINISSQPYKYKNALTTVTQTVSGDTTIILQNADMYTCPTMVVSSEMTITFKDISDPAASGILGRGVLGQMILGNNGYTTATITGTAKIPQFLIPAGGTTVTVSGSGTITFTYQEGLL